MSALAQHLQNLQNQLIALETQKFQNLKIQENQEKLIEDLCFVSGDTKSKYTIFPIELIVC